MLVQIVLSALPSTTHHGVNMVASKRVNREKNTRDHNQCERPTPKRVRVQSITEFVQEFIHKDTNCSKTMLQAVAKGLKIGRICMTIGQGNYVGANVSSPWGYRLSRVTE
jgi:hypothetical protein